jgi:hypothetical protein
MGHMKTCLILVLGFVVFAYPVSGKNILGICVAVGGTMLYGELKRRIAEAAKLANKYASVPTADGDNDVELQAVANNGDKK